MAISGEGFTEAQVIERLQEIIQTSDPRVSIGIGDDAAVVTSTGKQVFTTDMAVAEVHFRTDWSSAFEIGRKATAANTADLLAMSARADYLLVAVALTGSESIEWISELARGIKHEADLAGASIIGGDLSRADQVVISITAVGSTDKAVTRKGAKPGDGIYLSSLTGWSAAGLDILSSGFSSGGQSSSKALHEFKSPTIDYKSDFAGATSLCDVSDSLVIQGSQMADASKVSFEFDLAKIQAAPEFRELKILADEMRVDIWRWIFAGGEDHALLATGVDLPGIQIGQCGIGSGLQNLPSGVETSGWRHFK